MASLVANVKSRVSGSLPWTARVPLRVEKQIKEALRVPGVPLVAVHELAKERWPDVIGGITQFRQYARKLKEQANGKEVPGSGSGGKGTRTRAKTDARRNR